MATPKKSIPAAVSNHLRGIRFPAQKTDLIRHAKALNAPEEVCEALRRMPAGEYRTPLDVAKGLHRNQ